MPAVQSTGNSYYKGPIQAKHGGLKKKYVQKVCSYILWTSGRISFLFPKGGIFYPAITVTEAHPVGKSNERRMITGNINVENLRSAGWHLSPAKYLTRFSGVCQAHAVVQRMDDA